MADERPITAAHSELATDATRGGGALLRVARHDRHSKRSSKGLQPTRNAESLTRDTGVGVAPSLDVAPRRKDECATNDEDEQRAAAETNAYGGGDRGRLESRFGGRRWR